MTRLEKKGMLRVLMEGLFLLLLFMGLRYAFNLLLLPMLFPGTGTAALRLQYQIGAVPVLLLAIALWLGFPFFSILTLFGLLLSRLIALHYESLEGDAFPSIMANVLVMVSQGAGLLLGSISEYVIWFSERFSELRHGIKTGSPEEEPDDLLED